uniref:Uncharacterized protein n=1 Tax=Podoviridae sp. ctlpi2 TaxID=2826574 RepID=A0A8S5MM87_9CAUD|nr:MAG TPA: hypothetical protein [Podoviridae sp. ctlpi2]
MSCPVQPLHYNTTTTLSQPFVCLYHIDFYGKKCLTLPAAASILSPSAPQTAGSPPLPASPFAAIISLFSNLGDLWTSTNNCGRR